VDRIVLLDPSGGSDFGARLIAAGFDVETFSDSALAASRALAAPPRAIVASVVSTGISGVHLCRMLKAEPATTLVPVILFGPCDNRRLRFWAKRAGALDYISDAQTADLERIVVDAVASSTPDDFFVQLNGDEGIVQARITQQLDDALFDSTIAAEVRALGACASLEEAFERMTEFIAEILEIEWFALATNDPTWLGFCGESDVALKDVFDCDADAQTFRIRAGRFVSSNSKVPIVHDLMIGEQRFGRIACMSSDVEGDHATLHAERVLQVLARELPSPLRAITLGIQRSKLEVSLRHAQKLQALGRLSAGLAHELNTPLQAVMSNVSFLGDAIGALAQSIELRRAETIDDAAARSRIAEREEQLEIPYFLESAPTAIRDTLGSLQRMSVVVLALRQLVAGDAKVDALTDMNRAVENALIIAAAEFAGIADVKRDLAPDLPLVKCVAGDINQVLLNVISNAAHAIADARALGRPSGSISVRSQRRDDRIIISISDDGTGIAESIRSRIYDPFFTTKDVGRGMGQGLALAWTVVVEQHGGRIDFETSETTGTTFHIELPLDRLASRDSLAAE
jgi:signal transduction histidine kinase